MNWRIPIIVLIKAVSFCCLFVLSLLEAAWWTVYDDDIAKYEQRHGETKVSRLIKTKLLRERVTVVNFILLLIHLITFFVPLILGRLSQGLGRLMEVLLIVYGLSLFFVAEVNSKSRGYAIAVKAALRSAQAIHWCLRFPLLYPVSWVLRKLSGKERRILREEDVVATAYAASEHEALRPEEAALIQGVLRVGNQPVAALMVPLAKCLTVSEKTTRRKLSEALGMHSNVIVHAEKDPQTIRGIVERKMAWALADRHSDEGVNLKELVKPLDVITSDTLVEDALDCWKKHLGAIVTDGGKMVGIIMRHQVLDRMIGASV